jgi:hypothetical protein
MIAPGAVSAHARAKPVRKALGTARAAGQVAPRDIGGSNDAPRRDGHSMISPLSLLRERLPRPRLPARDITHQRRSLMCTVASGSSDVPRPSLAAYVAGTGPRARRTPPESASVGYPPTVLEVTQRARGKSLDTIGVIGAAARDALWYRRRGRCPPQPRRVRPGAREGLRHYTGRRIRRPSSSSSLLIRRSR